jgi:hypothetical protein
LGTKVSAEYRAVVIAMAGALGFSLWMVYAMPPASLPLTECMFHSVTGHSCLTCGMTRSLHAIAHGNLSASIRYHLFGPAVFIGMLVCLAGFGAEAVSGKKLWPRIYRKLWQPVLATVATAWLIYWLVRILTE